MAGPASAEGVYFGIETAGALATSKAVDQMVEDFLFPDGVPPDTPISDPPDPGGTGGGLSGTRIRTNGGLAFRLGHTHRHRLIGTTELHTDVAASLGRQRFSLPDGIGVFEDPAQLKTQYAALSGEISISTPLPVPASAATWRVHAGLGAEVVRARSRLRSALLDVPNTITAQSNYAQIGLEWASDTRPIRFEARYRHAFDGRRDGMLGFRYAF